MKSLIPILMNVKATPAAAGENVNNEMESRGEER
jgi:hypothetical protein